MTDDSYPDIPYEFGAGWNDLVNDTLDRLFAVDPDLEILQVKEKFGTLRLYYHTEFDHGTPQAMLIGTTVRDAEMRSERICEQCGLPGQLFSQNRRIFASCTKHAGDAIVVEDE